MKISNAFQSLISPLSLAAAAMSDGFLRQGMQQLGAAMQQRLVCGTMINYYHRPAHIQIKRRLPVPNITKLLYPKATTLGSNISEHVPIVMIHGLGDNALTWTLTMALMGSGRDIYALDLPGYGFSSLPPDHSYASIDEMVEIVQCFVREVVGQPAMLVGNSMGGWIAARFGMTAPELTYKVVLINAGGAYLEGQLSWEPFLEVVSVADLRMTRRAIRNVLGLIPAAFVYLGQKGIQERFSHAVVRAFVAAANENDFMTMQQLQKLQVPVAVVWGLRDEFLPQGSLEFFLRAFPNMPALLIDRCGHLPQRERPLLLARFLDEQAIRLDLVCLEAD